MGITHSTAPDDSFSNPAGRNAWTAEHTITEAGGQALTVGSISDGQFLKRSGTTITSGTASGSSIIFADAPNTDFDITNAGGGGTVTVLSKSVTGIAAGDAIELDIWYTILNNSGGVRQYTYGSALGAFSSSTAEVTSVAASATNRVSRRVTVSYSVSATNLAYMQAFEVGSNSTAAGTGIVPVLNYSVALWNTSASDLTGTQTITFTIASNNATTTQTLTLHRYVIRKMSTT